MAKSRIRSSGGNPARKGSSNRKPRVLTRGTERASRLKTGRQSGMLPGLGS